MDRTAIELLGAELIHLAHGVEVSWWPAAKRLGCQRLMNELDAFTGADLPGTARRLAQVIGDCLDATA